MGQCGVDDGRRRLQHTVVSSELPQVAEPAQDNPLVVRPSGLVIVPADILVPNKRVQPVID